MVVEIKSETTEKVTWPVAFPNFVHACASLVVDLWSWWEDNKQIKFLVSKETVVLRRWERSKQKFGFIKRVDKGEITTLKDLETWRFER